MAERINIAVIGAGENSQKNHLPVLQKLAEEGLIYLGIICDLNLTVATNAQSKFGFQYATHNAEEIFAQPDIDAVYVIGTVQMHHEYGIKALSAGKHIFLEKPAAPDLEKLIEIQKLAAQKKKLACVGFNRRFYKSINAAKEILQDKSKIYSLEGVYHKPFLNEKYMHGSSSWVSYSSIHGIDAVTYIMRDRPTEICSATNIVEGDVPQNVSVLFKYENGAHAVLSTNNTAGSRMEYYTIHTIGKSYTCDLTSLTVHSPESKEVIDFGSSDTRGFLEEHREFVSAINGELVPRNGIKEGVIVGTLVDLIEKGYSGKIDWSHLISEEKLSEKSSEVELSIPVKEIPKDGAILVLVPMLVRNSLAAIANKYRVVYPKDLESISAEEKKKIVAIITGHGGMEITSSILQDLPSLRVVGVVGASVKKYNPEAILERNISIVNASDVYADAVAEFTLMLSMLGIKNASRSHEALREGHWEIQTTKGFEAWIQNLKKIIKKKSPAALVPIFTKGWKYTKPVIAKGGDVRPPRNRGGNNLEGMTIGIIGFGIIAKKYIELLKPFKCSIKVWSDYVTPEQALALSVKKVTLADALNADIVSIHRGFSERTKNSFGKEEIERLKKGAVLINTARGEIINEEALVDRLKRKDIFACLDVFQNEPLPKNSPLRTLPNVFLTAHISGATKQTFDNSGKAVVEKVLSILEGRPVDQIKSKTLIENMS